MGPTPRLAVRAEPRHLGGNQSPTHPVIPTYSHQFPGPRTVPGAPDLQKSFFGSSQKKHVRSRCYHHPCFIEETCLFFLAALTEHPKLGGFYPTGVSSSWFWRLVSPRSRHRQIQRPVRTHFLLHRQPASSGVLPWRKWCGGPLWGLLYRGTNFIQQSSTLMT